MKKHSHWRKIRRIIRASDKRDRRHVRNLNEHLGRPLHRKACNPSMPNTTGTFVLIDRVIGGQPWDKPQLFRVRSHKVWPDHGGLIELGLVAMVDTPKCYDAEVAAQIGGDGSVLRGDISCDTYLDEVAEFVTSDRAVKIMEAQA